MPDNKPVYGQGTRPFRLGHSKVYFTSRPIDRKRITGIGVVGPPVYNASQSLEEINSLANQTRNELDHMTDSLHSTSYRLQKTQQALDFSLSHEELVYQGGILALLKAIEAKNRWTTHHIGRMVLFSLEIARTLGIRDQGLLKNILFIAMLHDIGKVGVREEVLNKPGSLTPEERDHVQTHAAIGAEVVASLPEWEGISRGVLSHHEWWDGSGYPNGWAGERIPLEARVVAVADVFDAVTSLRPYREPFPYFAARVHIELESGSHFDPQVVDAFLEVSEAQWMTLRHTTEIFLLDTLLQRPLSTLDLYSENHH